jgi:uridine phosphorylase
MDKYRVLNKVGKIAASELIINPDGSIYHLKLKPEHVAKDIIIVGDPGRVEIISNRFDIIEHKIQNREFITHTGIFNGKRITVLATGIGTDNIDIVLNELDAVVNIDLNTSEVKETHTSLNIVRIGTSGALQHDIPVDSFVASSYGMGFDGLLHYYDGTDEINESSICEAFCKHSKWTGSFAKPYIIKGSEELINKIAFDMTQGITATASGFYGPQGRELRLKVSKPDLNPSLTSFGFDGLRITNFEMETSALYGLSKMLGHNSCTVCAIIANRLAKQYSKDYKKSVELMIDVVLERLTR